MNHRERQTLVIDAEDWFLGIRLHNRLPVEARAADLKERLAILRNAASASRVVRTTPCFTESAIRS